MTADFVISQLLFLDAEDSTKDIKLFINSPGGSVTAGMSIKVLFTVFTSLLLIHLFLSVLDSQIHLNFELNFVFAQR